MNNPIENLGLQWLFITLLFVGVIQISAGIFKLGKFVRLIPHSVMMGFVNGLAIVIFLSQLNLFKENINGGGEGLKGSLPSFQFQIFTLFDTIIGHWSLIFSTAVLLAAVGLIESLMTLNLVDELTETRGSGNRECVAQGSANILNGFFGGMGGCAMIGQSIINVNSGGRGRLSGIVASIALLCFVLFGAPLIEQIPIAALVGVMFMVVIGTFAWSSFRIINKIPISDAIVLITVSAITVWKDLATAVIAGVIISTVVFAWKNATMIRARKRYKNDPDKIEIDFIESKVSDHSGIEAVKNITNKYFELGKEVKLIHLSPECKTLLLKADPEFDKNIETSIDDPRYYVVTDLMDREV